MVFFRSGGSANKNLGSAATGVSEADLIRDSGLFDVVWYAEKNLQGSLEGTDAIEHYIAKGAIEKRWPHPLFDPDWYAGQNPDLATSGLTPLGHYIQFSDQTSASPHPLFDPDWYRKQDGSLLEMRQGLFKHFLTSGAIRGLSPHPTFDPLHYYKQRPEVSKGGLNPLTHFVECGCLEGLDPNPFFDINWYRSEYIDSSSRESNPLIHFLRFGAINGARPHPEIDLLEYRQKNEQVARNPVAAYVHLVSAEDPTLYFEKVERQKSASAAALEDPLGNGLATEAIPAVDIRSFDSVISSFDLVPPAIAPAENERNISLIRQAAFVTFDIWDTVIRRNCHPDEVKFQSARFVLLIARDDLRPAFRDQIALYRARLQAENASARNKDYEFRFMVAVDRWLGTVLIPGLARPRLARFRRLVIEHELQMEKRSTRGDEGIKPLLDAAYPRALFASDFYMPAQFLHELLSQHNLGDRFVRGYASCDTYETKRDGSLFDRIINDISVEPDTLVHVGDNWRADVDVPASKGIETIHYTAPSEEARKAWFGKGLTDRLAGGQNVHGRRILALLEQMAKNVEATSHDDLFALGVRIAPIFAGYILSVVEDAISTGVEKVFFFTREGTFFRRLYDAISDANPFNIPPPSSDLLSVSRRATFAASMAEFSESELMRLWSLYSSQSLQGLTHSLNLDPEVTSRVGQRYDLAFEETIEYPWAHRAFGAVLRDQAFRQHAETRIKEQRDILLRYLRQQGFGGAKGDLQMIVDIGWRGTIQDNLALVCDGHIRGHYLALFRYLNVQPKNTDKSGWLGDDNAGYSRLITDAAPIEAICNSLGGSVIGYDLVGEKIVPRTQVVAGEEQAIETYFSRIQDGILAAVPAICDYMRLHGLMSSDIRSLAHNLTASLLERPPAGLCDAFWSLHHNETFGVGAVEVISSRGDITPLLTSRTGSKLHTAMSDELAGLRWPQSVVSRRSVATWWKQASLADRTSLPVIFSQVYCPAVIKARGAKLSVFVPPPIRGSGGHRTICNMTRALAKVGFEPHIFLEHSGHGVDVMEELLDDTPAIIHTQWHKHIPCDLAFATVAYSAPFVASVQSAHHRAYLVQDFEALFNPMSDGYLLAEDSFTWSLNHFTVGNWLTHVINTQYGAKSSPVGLGVDTAVYKPEETVQREKAICFLYQPDKPRRAPVRGADVLRRVWKAIPDVKIYIYGSDIPINLDVPYENLGLVNDLQELNRLYNKCAVGLCISGSNPSRIPFEMMAAGCIPVDLFRYNNLMDHEAGTALLAYQGASSVAAALTHLLVDTAGTAKRRTAAIASAKTRTLEWEMDGLANNVLALMDGDAPQTRGVEMMYEDQPFFAEDEDGKPQRRFSQWQTALASNKIFAS